LNTADLPPGDYTVWTEISWREGITKYLTLPLIIYEKN
jgi:hypothetical protein